MNLVITALWFCLLAFCNLGEDRASDDPNDTVWFGYWQQTRVFWGRIPDLAVLLVNVLGAIKPGVGASDPSQPSEPSQPSWSNLRRITLPALLCFAFLRAHSDYAVRYLGERLYLAPNQQGRIYSWLLATDYRLFLLLGFAAMLYHICVVHKNLLMWGCMKLCERCDALRIQPQDTVKYYEAFRKSVNDFEGTFLVQVLRFYVRTNAISVCFLVVSMALSVRPTSHLEWCLPLGRVRASINKESLTFWAFYRMEAHGTVNGQNDDVVSWPSFSWPSFSVDHNMLRPRVKLCLQQMTGSHSAKSVEIEAALQDVVVKRCGHSMQDDDARCELHISCGTFHAPDQASRGGDDAEDDVIIIRQIHDPVQRAPTHKLNWCSLLQAAVEASSSAAQMSLQLGRGGHAVATMHAISCMDHVLSSLGARHLMLRRQYYLLVAGCVSGFVGIWVAIWAGHGDLETGDLVAWPSSLSEAMSDFETGRGRVFFGFLFVSPMLLFASWFPFMMNPRRLALQYMQPGRVIESSGSKVNARRNKQHSTRQSSCLPCKVQIFMPSVRKICTIIGMSLSFPPIIVYAFRSRSLMATQAWDGWALLSCIAFMGSYGLYQARKMKCRMKCPERRGEVAPIPDKAIGATPAPREISRETQELNTVAKESDARGAASTVTYSANDAQSELEAWLQGPDGEQSSKDSQKETNWWSRWTDNAMCCLRQLTSCTGWTMCCLRQLTSGPSLLFVAIAPVASWVRTRMTV